MKRRFLFKANAVGLGGHLRRPVLSGIEAQATSSLPTTGGRASSRKRKFSIENIISVRRTYSEVVGSKNKESGFDTFATASADGLNVLHVVTVEKVVGALTAHSEEDHENVTVPTGSKIVDFKINGYPVTVDLDLDTFSELCTYSSIDRKFESDEGFREESKRRFFWGRLREDVPDFIRERFSWCGEQCESENRPPRSSGVIPCTLVRSITTEAPGVTVQGNVIIIPDFGKIFVAELLISPKSRRLTMLRFELGSPAEGGSEVASVESEPDYFP